MLLGGVAAIAAALPVHAAGTKAAPRFAPLAGAAAGYSGTHFGDGHLPAGCIVDRDQDNPDNTCFHLKVGLNALDSPEVNVAVLVPVSPTAERDMRLMTQAIEMWSGGIHGLAKQMNLAWLDKGVHINVTTKLVPVDAKGLPTQPINLVKPKIVVIATNPAGGIGIGIDPVQFVNELGLTGQNGVPCGSFANPFSMQQWMSTPGFDDHHGEEGGIFVKRCDGPGGNVCFSINGAVDPVPGKTDFFSIYDLVAHETGHCLTLGHVGDGADGPWGPTPTNDIMAYSSDPVDVAKCVSTLDVEGFALRMSNFLDVNGDGKVDAKDVLVPNDKLGDGSSSFDVQSPKDHLYASSTGQAEDCPQPDWGTLPLASATNWKPATVATTAPKLTVTSKMTGTGRLSWEGSASWLSTASVPTVRTASVTDLSGDGSTPLTDILGFTATTTPVAVKATIKVAQLLPSTVTGRVTGYGFYVGGRKFDSFVTTQGTSSDVQTIDSGARYLMPAGTSTWDTKAGTVSFTIPRDYLRHEGIEAPYAVFTETGVHIRTKDWVTSLDRAPDTGKVHLAAAPMPAAAPMMALDTKPTTTTVALKDSSNNTFTPADTSDEGVPLVPAIGNTHHLTLPITKQATVAVTLSWDDPLSGLGLAVKGGSGQVTKSNKDGSVTVTVPWAHHDLDVQVIPSQVLAPQVHYTVKAAVTTLTADKDHDGVPDVADSCKAKKGPVLSAGCPDTDSDGILDKNDACPTAAGLSTDGCPTAVNERVVALLDGKKIGSTYVVTRHGAYAVTGTVKAVKGKHTLTLVWYSGASIVKRVSRTVTV